MKVDFKKELKHLYNPSSKEAAEALYSIGIKTPEQFRQSDPEELYEELKRRRGGKLDKCVLYQLCGALLDIPWPKCKDLE